MLDDLKGLLNTIRGNYSKNPETSLARGRNLVRKNLGLILIFIAGLILAGIFKLPDFLLLGVYSAIPLVFEPSYLVEFLPLVGRVLPRATVLVELWAEIATVSVGISLTAIYAIYRFIGALDMGISWHQSRKSDDD